MTIRKSKHGPATKRASSVGETGEINAVLGQARCIPAIEQPSKSDTKDEMGLQSLRDDAVIGDGCFSARTERASERAIDRPTRLVASQLPPGQTLDVLPEGERTPWMLRMP